MSTKPEGTTKVEFTQVRCPFCEGRGGFDTPEDSAICAWCSGTGKLDPERCRAELRDIMRIHRERQKKTEEQRDKAVEACREVGGELPKIAEVIACYGAHHQLHLLQSCVGRLILAGEASA